MKTSIIYFDGRKSRVENVQAILAVRDAVFPRKTVPRHRIRWVRTSAVGGYWTT